MAKSPLGDRPLILRTTLARAFSKPNGAVLRTADKLKLKLPTSEAFTHRFLTVAQAEAIVADWLSIPGDAK